MVSKSKTILLMGLPNVGKSVIFNRLTGMNVSAANYCGTTVEYALGIMHISGNPVNLIDVPGTYSLTASNDAERVAVRMLSGDETGKDGPASARCHCNEYGCATDTFEPPEGVICVLDAGNMESSLYLLLQILQKNLPTMVVLNRSDLAREKGYRIDSRILSEELALPVIPTIAVRGEGMEELKEEIKNMILHTRSPGKTIPEEITWETVEKIMKKVRVNLAPEKTTARERWGDMLTKPWPGLPLALVIITLIFGAVVGIGLLLRQKVLLPFFRGLLFPQIENVVSSIIPSGFWQNILIGEYGFLIKGIEWPFALVLPYVISFYATLSFLEDSGYMPRLGILLEGLLNRIGLQGSGIIPILLGYGCAIPAILSTRALNSHKERLITTTMICLAIPCIAQTGSFITLLSARSISVMIGVFFLGFFAMIAVSIVLNRYIEGEPAETLMEIPDLLLPRVDILFKKVWLRIKNFAVDGALPMVIAVGAAAVLYETGIMLTLGIFMSPLVVSWLGLPPEASVPLILGIFRRELTVLPLMDMELTTLQLFTGATVGLFYVPCIAVIATLSREFNAKTAIFILTLTTLGAFLIGGIIAKVGGLFA